MGRFAVVACAMLAVGVLARSPRSQPPAPPAEGVTVSVDVRHRAAEVDARFVSLALDVAHVVGAPFWVDDAARTLDLRDPRLRSWASALGPTFLRVGGTDADRVIYDVGTTPVTKPPGAFVMTRARWHELADFSGAIGARVAFTLNAGPTARGSDGGWTPDGARSLVAYASSRRDPVDVWELGNEVNAFPVLHRTWLTPERYAQDLAIARTMLDELAPGARLAGPATAYWPVVGDLRRFLPATLAAGAGRHVDVVTWHYYPTQSHRCPVATRRARAGRPLGPAELDEIATWADVVERAKNAHAPGAQLWMGETGGAQCGGEPGLSDTWADALWWLDELGQLARRGQAVAVRQALVGADYGLLAPDDFAPRPSYWATWLWKRTMGSVVLAARIDEDVPALRAYAHCSAAAAPGSVTVLLQNLHPRVAATVRLGGFASHAMTVHTLSGQGPAARQVILDGQPIDGAEPPALTAVPASSKGVVIPPLGVSFVTVDAAAPGICP